MNTTVNAKITELSIEINKLNSIIYGISEQELRLEEVIFRSTVFTSLYIRGQERVCADIKEAILTIANYLYTSKVGRCKDLSGTMRLTLITSILKTYFDLELISNDTLIDIVEEFAKEHNFIVRTPCDNSNNGFKLYEVAKPVAVEEFPTVKEVKPKVQLPKTEFTEVKKRSKKGGKGTIISLQYSKDDLLSRRTIPKTEEEQKIQFNGWCCKKVNGVTCFTNDEAYIPITCTPLDTLNNMGDAKYKCDRKKCKLLLCKKIHDVAELKTAKSINDCMRSTVAASEEELKEDLFCRIIMKNMGKIGGKEVHDFYGILENISAVEKKYLLTWPQIEQIFKLKAQ